MNAALKQEPEALPERIRAIIGPSVEALGYSVVNIRVPEGNRRTLQVMAERTDSKGMTLDDCTLISQTVSALLDVEDPITSAYSLEVCSPGIDRPLFNAADFARYVGHAVKLEVLLPMNGRKRFNGIIQKADDTHVVIAFDNTEAEIAIDNIRQAKLVLTDALIKAYQDAHSES
jgi:ribosome maturation factor RimP